MTGYNRFRTGDAKRITDKPADMVPSTLLGFTSAGVALARVRDSGGRLNRPALPGNRLAVRKSGQGLSAGIARRRDLWRDRLSYWATARGTGNLAYLLDFELDFKSLHTERSVVN